MCVRFFNFKCLEKTFFFLFLSFSFFLVHNIFYKLILQHLIRKIIYKHLILIGLWLAIQIIDINEYKKVSLIETMHIIWKYLKMTQFAFVFNLIYLHFFKFVSFYFFKKCFCFLLTSLIINRLINQSCVTI